MKFWGFHSELGLIKILMTFDRVATIFRPISYLNPYPQFKQSTKKPSKTSQSTLLLTQLNNSNLETNTTTSKILNKHSIHICLKLLFILKLQTSSLSLFHDFIFFSKPKFCLFSSIHRIHTMLLHTAK